MRIAVPRTSRGWAAACHHLGHDCVEIPRLPGGHRFTSTLEERIAYGRQAFAQLRDEPVDLILDTFGDGLLFVDDPRGGGMSVALHERLGVPLVSYWTETLRIMFKQMDPVLMRRAFRSPTWFKAIFTRGHLREMEWLGIPDCFYLPAAALDLVYDTTPIDPTRQRGAVLLAANQQSRYFAHPDKVDTRTQWRGLLALARRAEDPRQTFLDTYCALGLGEPPLESDDDAVAAERMSRYYAAKLFYCAGLNLTQRDRFVLFLKRRLGDRFRLLGNRWDTTYGLDAEGYVEDRAKYLALLRTAPICINMSNGDNETGLNFRHFEIPAAGGFMLSYAQPELEEHFVIGRECDVFSDEATLMRTIDYYLSHPSRRVEIARAGQARVRQEHLVSHRLEAVLRRLSAQGSLHRAAEAAGVGRR